MVCWNLNIEVNTKHFCSARCPVIRILFPLHKEPSFHQTVTTNHVPPIKHYTTLHHLIITPHLSLLSLPFKSNPTSHSFHHKNIVRMLLKQAALIIFLLFSLYTTSNSQSCASYNFARNQIFSSCNDLPFLNAFLHWNYDQVARTLRIAYRHPGTSANRWVAWAVNPTGHGMVGSQALVAFQRSDGTMRVYTSPVTSYTTRLQEGDLSFPVTDLSATYARNEITIFATLRLGNMSSTLNQVWQEGPVSGNTPGIHPTTGTNLQSMGTVNLLSGQTGTVSGASSSMERKRNVSSDNT